MDIKLFKEEYHNLFNLLEQSSKLINQSFKRGAPEGPPVLNTVYELKMNLRKTTLSNPSKNEIQKTFQEILKYFSHEKETPEVTSLITQIHEYLNLLR